jgi:hypothetical protein
MKKELLIGLSLICNLSFGQVTLPYSSGFDNANEQSGWVHFQKAATSVGGWEISSSTPNSAPNCLSHDYAPSTGVTLADNWFVSPAFEIPSGGSLDSISYMFSGFSVPGMGDTVAVYLLQGSQDPDLANKTLLFDFRGAEYIADNTYRTKTNLSLSAYSGFSYVAFRYVNSDVSSYWLTTHFDDVKIVGNTASLEEDKFSESGMNTYPNPTNGEVFIENHLDEIQSLQIVDMQGRVHVSLNDVQDEIIKVDLSSFDSGVYLIKAKSNNETLTSRILVE